ncbi:MAG: M23 family metallopeptidase [Chloroflexi bacterium]|nr:M23 family metallopeptidase [Chloroflexota bacterium]
MTFDGRDPIPIAFPLRGEWQALRTPGTRVPSHGTDRFAQRYAYDLWRVDHRAGGYHPASRLRMWLVGVRTRDCYGWGEAIHSPIDGTVVRAVDGIAERAWLHPLRELARIAVMSLTFRPERATALAGNHVIVQGAEGSVLVAHLAPGSVAVSVGQGVRAGERLGRVGHTGNSTAPHLHLQLMDGSEPLTARGLLAAFREYEVQRGDAWERVRDGIPTADDRIRSVDAR